MTHSNISPCCGASAGTDGVCSKCGGIVKLEKVSSSEHIQDTEKKLR